jgi:glycyl-tRNA synthetase beta subunit
VLQARFEDAQFFYDSDLKQPLEAYVPKLEGTQFHKALGNLLQKTERVTGLIRPLAEATGLQGASCPSSSSGSHFSAPECGGRCGACGD